MCMASDTELSLFERARKGEREEGKYEDSETDFAVP